MEDVTDKVRYFLSGAIDVGNNGPAGGVCFVYFGDEVKFGASGFADDKGFSLGGKVALGDFMLNRLTNRLVVVSSVVTI